MGLAEPVWACLEQQPLQGEIFAEQDIFRCGTAVSQWHLGAQNYGYVGHSKAAG